MKYILDSGNTWHDCSSFYKKATGAAKHIGKALLSVSNKQPCHLYLYKKPPKKKTNHKRKIRYGKMYVVYVKSTHDPWLIATSLPYRYSSEKKIVIMYAVRMKIEHDFRDTKDSLQVVADNSRQILYEDLLQTWEYIQQGAHK